MNLDSGVAQPLQFDRAMPATPRAEAGTASQSVTCAVCQQTIAHKYFDVNGQPTCDRCKQQVARAAETPTGLGVFGRALVYGLGAAILGAVLYYAVIAITDFEIGLVAIAIGYMVGYAVRSATGDRGGLRFQILAIVLTYWAVGLAYTPFVFSGATQSQDQAQIAPASTDSAATELPPAEAPAEPLGMLIGAGIMLALTFVLPLLSVFGSLPSGLISAAIIAFGMLQAWQMTARPAVVISGPYRIAPPTTPA